MGSQRVRHVWAQMYAQELFTMSFKFYSHRFHYMLEHCKKKQNSNHLPILRQRGRGTFSWTSPPNSETLFYHLGSISPMSTKPNQWNCFLNLIIYKSIHSTNLAVSLFYPVCFFLPLLVAILDGLDDSFIYLASKFFCPYIQWPTLPHSFGNPHP